MNDTIKKIQHHRSIRSYLDKDIRYHISDSGNNFGCSNIAYKVPYEKDECKESEIKFQLFNNLFNYHFYAIFDK